MSNETGDVAGYADLTGSQTHHPVIWKSGRIEDLGTVENDPCGEALSLNADGQVVGGTSDCSYFLHAFLWESGGSIIDLNTLIPAGSGVQLTFALDINDRGEILAKALPQGGNPYQDPDLYGHLVLLVPCDEDHPGLEGCDYSMLEAGVATAFSAAAPATGIANPLHQGSPPFGGLPNRMLGRRVPHSFGVFE